MSDKNNFYDNDLNMELNLTNLNVNPVTDQNLNPTQTPKPFHKMEDLSLSDKENINCNSNNNNNVCNEPVHFKTLNGKVIKSVQPPVKGVKSNYTVSECFNIPYICQVMKFHN